MPTVKIAILATLLVGLAGLLACNDKDADEQQTSASKAVAGQQSAAQKPEQKPDADEGEEGEEGPAHSRCRGRRKSQLPSTSPANNSFTTSIATRQDSCPRSFTAQKPGEVHKRSGS